MRGQALLSGRGHIMSLVTHRKTKPIGWLCAHVGLLKRWMRLSQLQLRALISGDPHRV